MTSIALIGPRCTGKTEKGKILAEIRHVPFVDADEIFERDYRQTVKSFVEELGWTAFREAETATLKQIINDHSGENIILAPGGGAVAHDQGEEYRLQNVKMLRKFGQVVYLIPTPNLEECAGILVGRMSKDPRSKGQRPSLTGANDMYEDMLNTLKKRHPLYQEAAHHIVYTGDMTSSQIAWVINDMIK